MIRSLRNLFLTFVVLLGLAGAAVLFYPMDASIDPVFEQPADPLPAPFREALRYQLSDTGSSWDIYRQAAMILARQAPRDGPSLGISPLFIAARLLVFSRLTQSEWLIARTYLPPCWTKGHYDLTVVEALYLAARMSAPWRNDPELIRHGMARIAERAVAAQSPFAQDFVAAAAGPLPTCP